uniref:Zinc finger PHD-type domain-containing protein n=1 Tax=Aegilops tauschii subsp. strangulata TaxID=200361 RepID=A0A453HR77_AEGTS
MPNRLMVGKETVVKIVEDTFRKMREPANAVSASGNQNELGYSVMPMKNPDDSAQLDIKVRCPCGNSMATGSMIQCDHPRCSVWQHIDCVIIPEKTADTAPQELPSSFYCEMCRVSRADPFWVTINHPLLPVSVAPSNIMADGSYTVQYIEKTFPLSRANREMLQKAEYDIQVWCILLDDKVPFRMHWPLHSDMQING